MFKFFKKKNHKEVEFFYDPGYEPTKVVFTKKQCSKCLADEPGTFACKRQNGTTVFCVCLKCVKQLFESNCGSVNTIEISTETKKD